MVLFLSRSSASLAVKPYSGFSARIVARGKLGIRLLALDVTSSWGNKDLRGSIFVVLVQIRNAQMEMWQTSRKPEREAWRKD